MKGQIINKPGGQNVYLNVPKDYTESVSKLNNYQNILVAENVV